MKRSLKPEFILRPFDAPRPRLHSPRADFIVESGAKTYLAREANGLLFLRDTNRDSADFTLAIGEPMPDTEDLEAWAREQIDTSHVARFVLLPFRGEHLFREFPLFFRPDGTGFCRESWNRDDYAFEHDLSLHDWLEAPAPALYASAGEIFRREVAPQLSNARLPADRNHALTFHNGARADLRAVLRAAFALENLDNNGIIRATGQSETTFDRAGFWAARGEGGEVEVWFDRQSGQRYRLPWKADSLQLSRRFWMLGDLAIDATTPTGIYWDYHDEGRGRLSETPHARDFSLQFIADKLPPREEAQSWLRTWLVSIGANAEILEWSEIEVFEAREREADV